MPRSPHSLRTVKLGQDPGMFRLEMDSKAFCEHIYFYRCCNGSSSYLTLPNADKQRMLMLQKHVIKLIFKLRLLFKVIKT